MANKETIDKVKSLLEGHCYGPLKEAAEKWLAVADEKYGDKFDELKEKAGDAYDKLEDFAGKYQEASVKFTESMAEVSDKLADAYDKAAEKAGPALDKLGDKVGELADKYAQSSVKFGDKMDAVSDKLGDASEKFLKGELIKQLKEGVCTVDDLLETFGSKDAAEKFGEEFSSKMKAHAEALKEKGETFCDCDACRKARSILKDFGEDIEAGFEKAKEAAEEKLGDKEE